MKILNDPYRVQYVEMALCYMSDYYIYKHNHIDVAKRKTSCEPEDKNFYINFDVHVGNIYNLIFI